ncbi:MAG: iron ABC transporter permease [Rubrivivax sp.]|nr:iron ABC transporter permease [Rubrivivax sp.]
MRVLLVLLCLVLAAPVAGVLLSWVRLDAQALAVLGHQAQTVMAGYVGQSLLLAVGVAVGTAVLGVGTAVAVALFRFPGRRFFEWGLLLPMAMPAYVLAYAATDALQPSGPLQQALRQTLDAWRGAGPSAGAGGPLVPYVLPDVRSLGGAIPLFVLCLYPYVYLLTRTALGDRAVQMMEAARLLGAGLTRRLLTVALPLARPAVVAGVALALMETLADYGVGAFFGLATFTTGIYRAWLSMNDPVAALQLASLLLAVVALLLALERRAQARLRFASSRAGAAQAAEARPVVLRGAAGWAMWGFCVLPVLLGFGLPVAWLLGMLWREAQYAEMGLPLERFVQWSWATFRLAGISALAATAVALALGFALRRPHAARPGADAALGWAARLLSLGYAVPGAVVAIGILVPLGWVQQRWPESALTPWFTGTVLGVLYAYLVRFSSVALQSVEAGYARVPASVDETARMLGAGRARVFWRLHLPLLRRPALAAMLLVFVDVMKELPATLVLRPFGSDTLAVVAYNLARDERLAEAALPSLAIVGVGLLPVLLLSRAMRQT